MRIPRVERVIDNEDVVVETEGAIIRVNRASPARIELTQKINGPIKRAYIELATSFEKLAVDHWDQDECTLYVPVADFGFNIRIFGDSLVSIRAGGSVAVRTFGEWMPEYSYSEEGNLLLLDRNGGLGQYLLPSAHPYGTSHHVPQPGISFNNKGWETLFTLPATSSTLFSVCPPRAFDSESSVSDRIVHHFIHDKRDDGTWDFYPTDEKIEELSRSGNILALHVWQKGAGPDRDKEITGRVDLYMRAAPQASRVYAPLDEAELKRVVETAHRCGMRVVPYMSPLFFPGRPLEFLAELERVLEAYTFDGVYYDGVSEDILDAYDVMKGTRHILGEERVLYVHIPSPIMGSSYKRGKYVYAPFIDTYADFILRAEHIDTFDDKVLRYTISGHNISNAIGFACNYDYNLEFNEALMQRVLEYHVRLPYWNGWDLYLDDRGKAVGKSYPRHADIQKLMHDVYFPALDRLNGGRTD